MTMKKMGSPLSVLTHRAAPERILYVIVLLRNNTYTVTQTNKIRSPSQFGHGLYCTQRNAHTHIHIYIATYLHRKEGKGRKVQKDLQKLAKLLGWWILFLLINCVVKPLPGSRTMTKTASSSSSSSPYSKVETLHLSWPHNHSCTPQQPVKRKPHISNPLATRDF